MKLFFDGPLADLGARQRERLVDRRPEDEPGLGEGVRSILAEVREGGDRALRDMARRFDEVELDRIEVPRARWEEARDGLDPELLGALEGAAANIDAFHRAQLREPLEVELTPGVRLGRRAVPLERAGVYAPGGRASYPSSVLMGVVPARAAGVGEVVVCSPPGPSGEPPAGVLAACAVAGADRLFAAGGAGAVAALTWGTETIPRADVLVGPGNRWVTEAKRQVAGEVRIDGPAGPSEILVVAEEGAADPLRIATELVAQAEHDPDAAAVLATPSPALLERTRTALEREVERTPRRAIVRKALGRRGALLRTRDLDAALVFAEVYAPEHLALHTADPRRDLERVRTAGTVFLGDPSSVVFGDYLTGANHVLPTGGRARSFAGLSVDHFVRAYTYQEVSPDAARSLADPTRRLALAEGLPGHARAAELRGRAGGEAS